MRRGNEKGRSPDLLCRIWTIFSGFGSYPGNVTQHNKDRHRYKFSNLIEIFFHVFESILGDATRTRIRSKVDRIRNPVKTQQCRIKQVRNRTANVGPKHNREAKRRDKIKIGHLDRPVIGSIFRLMFSTSPNWVKYSLMSESLASWGRAPTNNFRSSSCTGFAILCCYFLQNIEVD